MIELCYHAMDSLNVRTPPSFPYRCLVMWLEVGSCPRSHSCVSVKVIMVSIRISLQRLYRLQLDLKTETIYSSFSITVKTKSYCLDTGGFLCEVMFFITTKQLHHYNQVHVKQFSLFIMKHMWLYGLTQEL